MAWPGTIFDNRSLVESYRPLYLLTFRATDGAYLRVCTDPLNTTEAGYAVSYGGNQYLGRVLDESMGQLQSLSSEGLDVMPNVGIKLANADMAMFDWDAAHGFLGAKLSVVFVLWEPGTSNFSTDEEKVFTGRCGAPEIDDLECTIQATNILNLTRRMLPTFPVQRRCPKIQPTSSAEWALADDPTSRFYACGLHAPGGAAPAFVQVCNQTPEGCKANNNWNRFAGIQWNPPDVGVTREYVSGNQIDVKSDKNAAKYGDYAPLVLGTAWVDALVTNSIPDGNSTRGEAIVCDGVVNGILKVVVNDEELPAATDLDGNPYLVENPLFRYNVWNKGDRDGQANPDSLFDGKGDTYGSLCYIEWCVPRKVESGGVPRVRVLVRGEKVRVYSDSTTYTELYSDNPAWQILRILQRCGVDLSDVDLDSFISAAAYYSQSVTYTDQYGATSTHARAAVSLVIRQRRSAADLVSGLLRGCNSYLLWSTDSGKIQLRYRGTLADQQASAPAATNYGVAISSHTAAGVVTNGYAAYRFTAGEITKDRTGKASIRRLARSIADLPNRVSFGFSNSEREWSADSVAVVDVAAINEAGQEIDAQVKVDGVNTLDQGQRIARTYLHEVRAGQWEIEASYRAYNVKPGQLVAVDYAKYSLSNQLMRVMRIAPSKNGERIKFSLAEHDDAWYLNTNGQSPDSLRGNPARNRLARPAYPWAPYMVQPAVGDPLYDRYDFNFGLAPEYAPMGDGSKQQRLAITGRLPMNSPSTAIQPPILARQGTQGAVGSGTLPGGGWTYYVAVCAQDASGNVSAPSGISTVHVTGAGLYSITIPVVQWDPLTHNYRVYVGQSPNTMTGTTVALGRPASITISLWQYNVSGVPDTEFWGLIARMKHVINGGVFGALVTATEVESSTITVPGCGAGSTNWTGYDCYIAAKGNKTELPILNFRVTGNTADVLTVTPNPYTLGVRAGDVLVMWGKQTVAGLRITDPRWKNPMSNAGAGLIPGDLIGLVWRWMAGTGRGESYRITDNGDDWIEVQGPWLTTPDSTSRGIVEALEYLPETFDLAEVNNADLFAYTKLTLPTANYAGTMVRVIVAAYDGAGNEAADFSNPERLMWLLGDPTGGADDGEVWNDAVGPVTY